MKKKNKAKNNTREIVSNWTYYYVNLESYQIETFIIYSTDIKKKSLLIIKLTLTFRITRLNDLTTILITLN